MIVLADRNFDDATLLEALAATDAHLLVRLKSNRKLPLRRSCSPASYPDKPAHHKVRRCSLRSWLHRRTFRDRGLGAPSGRTVLARPWTTVWRA